MAFKNRAVALYFATGAVVLGNAVWMAATGRNIYSALQLGSPNRLLGAGRTFASGYLLTDPPNSEHTNCDLARRRPHDGSAEVSTDPQHLAMSPTICRFALCQSSITRIGTLPLLPSPPPTDLSSRQRTVIEHGHRVR